MEFIERAKIKLDHWIHHNAHHLSDYEELARGLEDAGRPESAGYMREVMDLVQKGSELLKRAREALDRDRG